MGYRPPFTCGICGCALEYERMHGRHEPLCPECDAEWDRRWDAGMCPYCDKNKRMEPYTCCRECWDSAGVQFVGYPKAMNC